ncbi:MAG: hypothetical protein KIT25_10575 [Enhydrobacter sp.]|nr:MAG: hypothetical protein KIT25_10575 [Enhydrobacter sp.]
MMASMEAGRAMSTVGTDYCVLVTERSGEYELRIRELHLVARGPDLQQAYEDLMARKRKIIDWARLLDALDELPVPEPPSPVRARARHLPGLIGARLHGTKAISVVIGDRR